MRCIKIGPAEKHHCLIRFDEICLEYAHQRIITRNMFIYFSYIMETGIVCKRYQFARGNQNSVLDSVRAVHTKQAENFLYKQTSL